MITNYTGVSGSRIAWLIAKRPENKMLIVVSSGRQAERLAGDLSFCAPEARIITLQEEDDVHVQYEARDRESVIGRLTAMHALLEGSNSYTDQDIRTGNGRLYVIAPVSSVLRPTEIPERYVEGIVSVSIGDVIEPSDLKEMLVRSGYTSSPVTESPGEFTSRGGIIDVFPPSSPHPVRIEFFGDEIDSLRSYDQDTQRTIDNMQQASIGPAAEFIPTADEIDKARKSTDIFGEETSVQMYADFLEYFDADIAYLHDYASAGGAGFSLIDPSRLIETLTEEDRKKDFTGIYGADCDICVYTPYPEMIRGAERIDEIINVRSRQIAPFNGQIDLFAEETGRLISSGYQVTIVSSSDERSDRLREYLQVADADAGVIFRTGTLSAGFILDDEKICLITESDIYPESRRRARRPSKKKSSAESIQFSDLHKGDYIVHEVHGIGRFEGVKAVTADGQTRDYLVIRYAGSDVLYIPIEQLDIIQKYIGNSGNAPALSRLSGGSWKKTRERARRAAEKIAEDLVKLYAERQAAGGHAFGRDTVWQGEFEDSFPYTETDDQLRAVEEIKADMEKPLPMDRLLIGDVGYGKTEVAARAIFKCLSEGKQAALLAPTTLLVNQHYHTLKERYRGFPFEIDELSRFKSAREQKKAIERLTSGDTDLIIGTHRLLSEDVRFRDLGLLVIDEEQRFGVRHKEKIKTMKQNIDVLTLSATPIPRTLNMSLAGIKDISLIDEPPGDRLPVHTYVTPYEEEILSNAIRRELARGGQVFIVSNRITGLNQIRETVERLVPEAECAVGHGRMSEDELENTMLDFVEGRTNVLIATTIIENGIDIPNANTMIILNADRFGLAQLYQLRGRVGRSHRLAYAYLMYQPGKVLTEIARKRLTAIREFTEFGAGFKLAMRDLELRGAGNMLGEAQSGHIESIGYELYCKEIDRAVRRLKGETVTDARADITIDLEIAASIPESYIEDETLRLQAYRRISSVMCTEDAEDVIDELTDRYGDLPTETLSLIRTAELRSHAEMLGASLITRRGPRIEVRFAENNRFSAYTAVMTKAEFGDALTISSGRNTMLSLYAGRASANNDVEKALALLRSLRYAAEAEAAANL